MLSPTKLKELCKEYGLTPSKKYGQNYLIQDGPIKKMVAAAEISNDDIVIEIGPGFGILTFALAEVAKQVVAFEIEKKLEKYWEENKPKNVEIVWGNALTQISNFKFQISNYEVVANLPYQITSNAIRTLLELENKPDSITIMVQKEVAERICARPPSLRSGVSGRASSVPMSLLAISTQYYGEPKIIDFVNKGNFWPEPKVDSAILHIKTLKHKNIKTVNDKDFFKVVKAGFANKRKQLHKNLSVGLKLDGIWVKDVLRHVCGNELIRAEELSVSQWTEIVKKLSPGD